MTAFPLTLDDVQLGDLYYALAMARTDPRVSDEDRRHLGKLRDSIRKQTGTAPIPSRVDGRRKAGTR